MKVVSNLKWDLIFISFTSLGVVPYLYWETTDPNLYNSLSLTINAAYPVICFLLCGAVLLCIMRKWNCSLLVLSVFLHIFIFYGFLMITLYSVPFLAGISCCGPSYFNLDQFDHMNEYFQACKVIDFECKDLMIPMAIGWGFLLLNVYKTSGITHRLDEFRHHLKGSESDYSIFLSRSTSFVDDPDNLPVAAVSRGQLSESGNASNGVRSAESTVA